MTTTTSPPQPRQISLGILLIPLQALDAIGPMDILHTLSASLVSMAFGPDTAARLAPPTITFHHIGPTSDPVLTTGSCSILPTCTIANCPPLDVLLIGGPDPEYASTLPGPMREFIVQRSTEVSAILTTCTGGLVLAATGLLDGLEATTNHIMLPGLGMAIAPKVSWKRDVNWVVSSRPRAQGQETGKGKGGSVTFWTAAGAVAGMDMVAQWVREEFENGQALLDCATSLLEWAPRDVNGRFVRSMNGRGEFVENGTVVKM